MIVTEKMVTKAYNDLKLSTQLYQEAGKHLADVRKAHDEAYSLGVLSGKVTGKNQGERDASFLELKPDLVSLLRRAEQEEQDARFKVDICKIGVEYVRTLLRLDEMTTVNSVE